MNVDTRKLIYLLRHYRISLREFENEISAFDLVRQREIVLDVEQAEVLLKYFTVGEVLAMLKGHSRTTAMMAFGGAI